MTDEEIVVLARRHGQHCMSCDGPWDGVGTFSVEYCREGLITFARAVLAEDKRARDVDETHAILNAHGEKR